MRIVVTGAGGGLGRAFLDVVPGHNDVVAFTRAELDIGDHDAVMQVVPLLRPDAVFNLAAFTKVDENETDPDRAFRDNARGPQSLALAARACGAVFLHVSTDYVFDGEKPTPYDEADEPRPLPAVYARSKLLGERLVRDASREHLIARVGYLFGGGNDHLTRAIERLRRGETVGGFADRRGTPTFVRHLAERLLPLVLAERFGTYHLAASEAASWFQVLSRARELGDLPGEVVPQRADEVSLPAPRPRNSSLTSVLLPGLPVPPFPSLDEALAEVLARS